MSNQYGRVLDGEDTIAVGRADNDGVVIVRCVDTSLQRTGLYVNAEIKLRSRLGGVGSSVPSYQNI